MSSEQQQTPTMTFEIPVAYPPELINLTKDLTVLKDVLSVEIELYREKNQKRVFSEKEAAEDFFGISVKSMREIRNAGKIAFTPIKGQFFYTRDALEEYIERSQIRAKKGRK